MTVRVLALQLAPAQFEGTEVVQVLAPGMQVPGLEPRASNAASGNALGEGDWMGAECALCEAHPLNAAAGSSGTEARSTRNGAFEDRRRSPSPWTAYGLEGAHTWHIRMMTRRKTAPHQRAALQRPLQ